MPPNGADSSQCNLQYVALLVAMLIVVGLSGYILVGVLAFLILDLISLLGALGQYIADYTFDSINSLGRVVDSFCSILAGLGHIFIHLPLSITKIIRNPYSHIVNSTHILEHVSRSVEQILQHTYNHVTDPKSNINDLSMWIGRISQDTYRYLANCEIMAKSLSLELVPTFPYIERPTTESVIAFIMGFGTGYVFRAISGWARASVCIVARRIAPPSVRFRQVFISRR
jgi:hypothetical protein